MRTSLGSVGFRLLAVTIAAAGLSILLIVLDSHGRSILSNTDAMRSFQRTVGGLGMGSVAAPAWNLLYYDPRLQPVNDSNLWPVAGAYPYSPSALSSVVTFRELPREDLQILKVGQ
jgi:hypothetical protein